MISRMTGRLCGMPLPPHFRKYLYLGFGKLYGVNFDDILVSDLNQFRTFNQFFTREIHPSARQIADAQNDLSMCSPCDGKILSHGDVDSLKCTIDCVKGNDYRLDEFLFGFKTDKLPQDENRRITMVERILDSAKDRGNVVKYCVIYLAPQDYHRYHSPAYFTANYRRHIAGYLEPVMPSYLMNHKDVLKNNERVNVLGDWRHGFFAMSFIGALNVGSIKLHFDEDLQSNIVKPLEPYFTDKNYLLLMNKSDDLDVFGNQFMKIP